jgi:hypothetical protein
MPTTTPNRSASFANCVRSVLLRLRQLTTHAVRLVVAPSPDYAPYKAELGYHVVVYPAQPQSVGGGRYGTKVKRDVVVHVVTENLSDYAGSDEIAALAHLDVEDQVINAVVDNNREHTAEMIGPAVNIVWKQGGVPPSRLMKVDAGLVVSAIPFEVLYAQPHTIPEV